MYYDNECETCDRELGSQHAAIQHMDALDHWFLTRRSAEQHMDDTGHWEPQFECEHMSALDHYKQYHCRDCAKSFRNENALRMHLNSSTHRGRNVARPFCKTALTSASGLSHHLESGSCPRAGNSNHRTIFQAISQRDCGGLVTNKLLTYPDSGTQNIATGATWNGFNYECYLCHREFRNLQGLNQHLSSPAHSEKLYHCPNRDCTGQFVRLASLFNHLESESCNFVRFERVQKHVHDFITGRQKLIGFG
ncbi:zinc finger protein [Alternaria alternata]|uniref:Zinc finger protein n=1 Tax=Alternaria alternata TaxID=5599 RepID=A0A177D7Y2_ALTAL|nr:zinc finger protein [Alternaria alternata]OAG15212.1 zinc finger protein [Alternaria alternata]